MSRTAKQPLSLPPGATRLLLHSCCAPCSGAIVEALLDDGIDHTLFFYNPNIHPEDEYRQRKDEIARFAARQGVAFIDADYDPDTWFARTNGLENEPERGPRCTVCFSMRLERTALYAHDHGFGAIASTLGISRWKNLALVNECGHRAAQAHDGLVFWDVNWRKDGRTERRAEIVRRENFYQQTYCGCVSSLRDMNRRENHAEKTAESRSSFIPDTVPR